MVGKSGYNFILNPSATNQQKPPRSLAASSALTGKQVLGWPPPQLFTRRGRNRNSQLMTANHLGRLTVKIEKICAGLCLRKKYIERNILKPPSPYSHFSFDKTSWNLFVQYGALHWDANPHHCNQMQSVVHTKLTLTSAHKFSYITYDLCYIKHRKRFQIYS